MTPPRQTDPPPPLLRMAAILRPPETHPYGERQYSAEDPGGRFWTFSQSVADVDPAEWGGLLRAGEGGEGDGSGGRGAP